MKSRSSFLRSAGLAFCAGLAGLVPTFAQEAPPPGTPRVSVVATVDQGIFGNPDDALVFEFSRTGSVEAPLTVYYRVDGTARPMEDYVPAGTDNPFRRRLATDLWEIHAETRIPAGSTTTGIRFLPLPDRTQLGDRELTVTLIVPLGLPDSQPYLTTPPDSATGRWLEFDPDGIPARVVLTSPRHESRWTAPASIRLVAATASAIDPVWKVEFLANDVVIGISDAACPTCLPPPFDPPHSPTHTLDWTDVPEGRYEIVARGYSQSHTLSSRPVTIEVGPADERAVLELVEPRPRERFEDPSTVVVRAVGVDPRGALTQVTFLANGERIGESQIVFVREPDPGTLLEHEFHWERPPAGLHRLGALAIDALGREVNAPTVMIEVLRSDEPPVSIPHPADRDPEDGRIDEAELARYATDWREGTAPDRIPIGHVTRAAYLVAEGGAYRHEPALGRLPLAWIPDGLPMAGNPPPTRPGFAFIAPPLWEGPDPSRTAILELVPAPGTRASAVEVWLRPGTRVRAVSDSGGHDPEAGVIRWGPFSDEAPRRLVVEWEGEDPAPWDGVASFDGHDVPLVPAQTPREPDRPFIESLRRLPSGEVQIVIRDPASAAQELPTHCAVEVSLDLRTWRRLATGSAGENCLLLSDADSESQPAPARFYRVVREPAADHAE